MNLNRIIIIISLVWFCAEAHAQNQSESFSIIAFGDMPYVLPQDYLRFENLIKKVNEEHQAFNVHVGDIKSSSTPCNDDYFQKIYNYFEQFQRPLIYTPGDNEWTDCHRKDAGSFDPRERLSKVREMFFAVQREQPLKYAKTRQNARDHATD